MSPRIVRHFPYLTGVHRLGAGQRCRRRGDCGRQRSGFAALGKEDGTTVIPFFTSLEALQQAVEDEQAFVVMPARTLFEMTLGETLFLNAKLPTGKEFMPREISLLLAEEGSPLSTQEVLEGGESLILSEVAEPPSQMIDSLTTLFKTIKPVKRAFLCAIKEHADAQPNLLIGIEADGEIEEIIHAAGNVATDTLPGTNRSIFAG